jgi:hypothetical protein
MNGQLVENKFYAQAADAVTAAVVEELAHIVADWVGSTFLGVVGNNYTHTRVKARDISADASFEFIDNSQGGNAGTAGAVDGSGGESVAIHRNTLFSGKKQKSRIYWPNIEILAKTDNNHVSSAWATEKVSALTGLNDAILAGIESDYIVGYPQRILDGVRLTTANFIQSVGWSMVDLAIDSMRRRLSGRGV